jgi:hypothetical protein
VPFRVAFLEDEGIVELVLAGVIDVASLQVAITMAGREGVERLSGRYLVDSSAQLAGGNAFDVLSLAEHVAAMGPGFLERQAFVSPDEARAAEHIAFYETAARNRGLEVRVFPCREEALAWLTA